MIHKQIKKIGRIDFFADNVFDLDCRELARDDEKRNPIDVNHDFRIKSEPVMTEWDLLIREGSRRDISHERVGEIRKRLTTLRRKKRMLSKVI
ncbi:hypothetical protein [Cohnella sp. WQ 127256]|uniref:hypothetical protein n=1 Tax=Cohnella sp. WQ 127256 TaxID=2938790 RepID=UPI0021194FE8|nr:hypothetical protein [Cohnella sp. WQ 127256]